MPGEKEFLGLLSAVDRLKRERPVLDGAALVFRIEHEGAVAELIVEVRLPGYALVDACPRDGKLLAFLQNLADNPLKLSAPEFVMTGGLLLPWTVGITVIANDYRGELGEALAWQTPLNGSEDVELLAGEIGHILDICRAIIHS